MNDNNTPEYITNDQQSAPYIIAETACAHDGDAETLRKIISEIESAEPDAIQVQIFRPDHQMRPEEEMYEKLKQLALPLETWSEILKKLREMNPDTFVYALDLPSLNFAINKHVDAIKLGSGDIENPEMISRAASADVPTNISTGGCSLDEIKHTLAEYYRNADSDPVLMHGIQNFPTPVETGWINRINLLQDVFELPVGYQDHTDSTTQLSKYIDLLAVGVGAAVLEKHVTLSRSDTETDFEAALEPEEFNNYTHTIRTASQAIGSKTLRTSTESQREYQKFQKKRVVTTESIESGDQIRREDVGFLRTTSSLEGISPRRFMQFEDVAASNDIPPSKSITLSDIDTSQ